MNSSLNHIYRVIWSEALCAWVAVSEITKSKGKRAVTSVIRALRAGASLLANSDDPFASRLAPAIKPLALALACCFALNAQANPIGGSVVSGQASFNSVGNTLTVTNTPGTIIHWQGFSIQQTEITRFAQQSASSAVLNRVITNNPSLILGTLQSNGRVFLVNPGGIVFGAGSTVDVAGLVATSLNISDADFQAGHLNFTQVPGAQAISNAGNLTAQSGGEIYLIAPNVENSGVITAPNGEILLAAGHEVQLVNTLDPNLRVNITAAAGDATNVGQLVASAGRLGLFGTVVKNTGSVSADSASLQGGKIVFRSSQRTEISGTASAQGVGGGEIKVLSDMQTGTVQVSGTLNASAPTVGEGGFIDTSAAHLDIKPTARISTAALSGKAGTWLIDPLNVTIGTGVDTGGSFSGGIWSPMATGSFITSGTIAAALNAGTNVTITTTTANAGFAEAGDINVNASITKTAIGIGLTTLTLKAENNIVVAAGVGITTSGDALGVVFNSDTDGNGSGAIVMNTGSSIVSGGGNVTFGGGVAGNGTGSAVGTLLNVDGIMLDNATLDAGGGNIALTGTGVAGGSADGVYVTNASLLQTFGAGTVTLTGTGGAGLGSNSGVRIGGGSSISSVDGAITLIGQGGASTGSSNRGIYVHNAAVISATGNGAVTLTGTGGSGTDHNTGVTVAVSGTTVSVVDGLLTLNGTSGAGSGTYNRGVNVQAGQVKATGLGSIAITGESNATATSSFGGGVELRAGGLVQSAIGAIGITGSCLAGTCGLGTSENKGIYIHDATGGSGNGAGKVLSTSGNITLTGTGWGTGTPNYGIYLFNDTALSSALSATVDAGVGGSSNISLVSAAGDIVLGAGTVAGANTSGNLSLNAGRDIVFNTALTRAAGGNANFSAANNILFAANSSLASSAGALNIALNSDSDGAGGGGIYLNTGSSIDSNGGNITMGGMPSTGRAIGNGTVTGGITFNSGIYVLGNITAGAGNVDMRGEGANNNLADGITFAGGTLSSNGIVNIDGIAHFYGTNRIGVNPFAAGVDFINAGTRLTTQTGTVTVTGTNTAPQSGIEGVGGIMVETGTIVETTGAGTLSFTGAANSYGASWGVGVLGTIQTTAAGGGAITLYGTNLNNADGGVVLWDGHVLSGGGAINLTGQSSGSGSAVGWLNTAPNALALGGPNSGNITIQGLGTADRIDFSLNGGFAHVIDAGSSALSITSPTGFPLNNVQISAGSVTLSSGGVITPVNGSVSAGIFTLSDGTWNQVAATLPGFTVNDFRIAGGTFIRALDGDGTALTPYQLADIYGVQGMGSAGMLGKFYVLANDIDATSTATWNFDTQSGTFFGFAPVGDNFTFPYSFSGQFDGQNHTISNLTINRPLENDVGLFGYMGLGAFASNVDLLNVNITGNTSVGGLAGYINNGSISNSHVSGGTVTGMGNDVGGLIGRGYSAGFIGYNSVVGLVVSGGTVVAGTGNYVGGLIGYDSGEGVFQSNTVTNTTVNGNNYVGGLAGMINAPTTCCGVIAGYSDNNHVIASFVNGGIDVGGLVGWNGVPISNSYVSGGTVNGSSSVGGLVGSNWGDISNSYVSGGSVSSIVGDGAGNAGGLVGFNSATGSITTSFALNTAVTFTSLAWTAGGLVGYNAGSISNSYVSSGSVSASSRAGGLVGYNIGSISNSYASNGIIGTGYIAAAGLVGRNDGSITDSFWDTDVSGFLVASGAGFGTETNATGLITAQMRQMASFTNWDIADTGGAGAIWRIYEGQTTPLLTSFLSPLTITAAGATKTYDAIAYSGGNGVTYSVTPTLSVLGTQAYVGTSQGAINAGSYAITPSGLYSDQLGYDISFVNGTLTITSAIVSLSPPLGITASDASKTYGTTLTFAGTEFTPVGLLGSDTIGSVTLTSLGAVNTANVGIYAIMPSNAVFSVGSASNYTIAYVNGQLTVTAAPLTVTATNASKIYDSLSFTGGNGWVSSGFVNADTSAVLSGTPTYGGTSQGAVNAGSYVITPGGLSAANYAITFVDGVLAVTPASLTVTADIQSKIYGDADPALTYVSSGLIGGGLLGGSLERAPGEDVSSYSINQGTLGNSNYTVNYIGNNLTITPRQISVAADSLSKVYGDADPALTFAIGGGGLAAWDTNATAFAGALTRVQGENVLGTPYAITQGTLVPSTNYELTGFTPNSMTITPRQISVAADTLNKVYGDVDPALTFAIGGGGLAAWDTNATAFTGALTRVQGENVPGSPYAITQGTLAANSNYTLTDFVPSFLSVSPAILTVDVYGIVKILGMPDPALSYSVSGLKFNDTQAGVLNGALSREGGNKGGVYLIHQGSLVLTSDNYAMNFLPDYFEILPTDVVQRITKMSLQVGTPEDETETTSDDENKKEVKDLLAAAGATNGTGQPLAEPLPVCPR